MVRPERLKEFLRPSGYGKTAKDEVSLAVTD